MGNYCGIDLGNKRTSICIIDNRRQVLLEVEVATDAETLSNALKGFKKLTCIVEASPLAEWLCTELEKYKHKVTVVCPRKAKVALASQSAKKKTDRRDAHGLAELARSGWYVEVHRKSEEARATRSYLVARKQLVESSGALASSIRGILRAHGVRLSGRGDGASFSDRVRTAAAVLPALVRGAIEGLLSAYELLHSQQKAMYKVLERAVPKDPVLMRLTSIPSVGAATAAAFVATIDDPSRFSSGEKVASYVGLVPSIYQSGETEYRGRIKKNGDKLLRWLFVEAAHYLLSCSKTPCELREWGLALEAKKGTGKARVAVARRLCMLMWQLWVNGEMFHAESLKQAA